MSEKKFFITFCFVSGKEFGIEYSETRFKEFLLSISKGWKDLISVDETLGINFSNVTHYIVREMKNRRDE